MMQVITGKAISGYRLLALKNALKLECKGMTRHGRSAYSIIKSEFGLHGSKQSVLAQFEAHLEVLGA